MTLEEAHEIIFAEVAQVCQFLYGDRPLVMVLNELQNQLQLVGNLRVRRIVFLIRHMSVQQKEKNAEVVT